MEMPLRNLPMKTEELVVEFPLVEHCNISFELDTVCSDSGDSSHGTYHSVAQ